MKTKIFKNCGMFIGTILLGVLVCACHNSDPDPFMSVSISDFSISSAGVDTTFAISSNCDWSVYSNKDWLKVNPSSGNSSTTTVNVSISSNPTTGKREATLTFNSNAGSKTIKVTQEAASGDIKLNGASGTELVFGDGSNGSEQTQIINLTSNTDWIVGAVPDWIRVSPTQGSGNASVSVTVLKENWSDEDRAEKIQISSDRGGVASLMIKQEAALAKNCRVTMSNITNMCDGIAADLSFGSKAVGYREAYFTVDILKYPEREIYDALMQETEYLTTKELTYLNGWVEPGTTIVYCAAAFGDERKQDNSHKYGPMLMQKITTKKKTPESDMPFYMSVGYSYDGVAQYLYWNIETLRIGEYGQKCDEYYYLYGTDDESNKSLYNWLNKVSYAYVAHVYLKPIIKSGKNYKFGPQLVSIDKKGDYFCFCTWGKNRDTKDFSSELYFDAIETNPMVTYGKRRTGDLQPSIEKRKKSNPEDWNRPHHIPSHEEIEAERQKFVVCKSQN